MCDIIDMKNKLDGTQLSNAVIPLWVYGSLRNGQKFDFYLMGGAHKIGDYNFKGAIIETELGDWHLDISFKDEIAKGELYCIDICCLLRIFHLENESGSFRKKYELYAAKVTSKDGNKCVPALYFDIKRKKKIDGGDVSTRKNTMTKLMEFLKDNKNTTLDNMEKFIDELIEKNSETPML